MQDGLVRALLRYPRLCYAVRGTQMRLRAATGRRGRAPRHSLRADADRFTGLFAGSELRFAELIGPWTHEFTWPAGRTNNGTFESVDVELYHAVLRTYRPELVIEVGGGHSSWFST